MNRGTSGDRPRRHDLHVSIRDLRDVREASSKVPEVEPRQALLRVDQFGLTLNNVTYMAAARPFGSWRYFPVSEQRGRVPVWGFASVVESRAPRVEVGERLFGYLPISTHLVVDVGEANDRGFVDNADHRAWLPAVYNWYRRVGDDPMDAAGLEDYQMLLWPLLYTAFMFDDALVEHDFFGASDVVVSSASSKTSIAIAKVLARRHRVGVTALTSEANLDFVERLQLYNDAITYDSLNRFPSGRLIFVDVAGDKAVRRRVHELGDHRIAKSFIIGATHWESPDDDSARPLPGPRAELFAAPHHIERRTAELGATVLETRLAEVWQWFVADAPSWLRTQHHSGPGAVRDLYLELLDGKVSPAVGSVGSMWPAR